MKTGLLILCLMGASFFSKAQQHYPKEVELVLQQTPSNRKELEKAIDYFKKEGDPQKLKAIYFLIANMDIHYSANYYWADEHNRRIAFNELQYPDFTSSVKAFNDIKKKNAGIHPVSYTYRDIDSIRSGFLINNVDQAFKVWHTTWAKNLSFGYFCDYILPYRISVEPLQDWNAAYRKRFSWIADSAKNKTAEQALQYLVADYKKWFVNTYQVEKRAEPLPRLGALQLLSRKKGHCEDIADLEVFTLRSQGIGASIDVVPYWATSSGSHYLNVCFDNQAKPVSFDVSTPSVTNEKLAREPAKVLRLTYSKQAGALTNFESKDNIPDGILQTPNYIDVTREYWQTKDVQSDVQPGPPGEKIAYACVFNFMHWRPVWWGQVQNKKVVFKDMCKGAVFLPMYYKGKKLLPAAYPVASGYTSTVVLKPDVQHKQRLSVTEQAGYLVFRPGKKYHLFYWDNAWKLVGTQHAEPGTRQLVYDNVPQNALLLVVPEYTQHKERPFFMTNNERHWL